LYTLQLIHSRLKVAAFFLGNAYISWVMHIFSGATNVGFTRGCEIRGLTTMRFSHVAGDHALTALAIGKMLGITGSGQVYTGPELDTMSDDELAKIVLGCNVYARASPENKLRIVRALQVSLGIA
jgi:hypothetical protein